ncbi:MAG: AAA family ATPase [Gemmatimonadaceae bacterium]
MGWRLQLEARIASGDLIDARADADHFEEWLRKEEWNPEPASRSILKLARAASPGRNTDVDSDLLVSELVGREREFAAINAAWSEAQTRGARIVHIVAESGHGKTRLTRDVLSRIRVSRGAVHYIKANYGEREIPYSFAAAIAEAIASSPGAGGVAPAAANTLVSLNPALSASYSQSSRIPEQLEPLRVGLALLDLLTAVAEEEPLAIALDDLHWCDAHSREALTIVLSRIKAINVLVIVTARPQYIVSSSGDDRLEMRLSRLGQDEVTSLITSIARLPEEPWALRLPVVLAQSSGGSPFQILETLHYCLDTGLLSRVDEAWQCNDLAALMLALEQHGSIDRRMATLSTAEHAVLLALGIAGMPTKRTIVVKATELTGQVADEAAANLEVRGMLVADGDVWSLAHDAIAETVLSNAENEVQEAMHARLGGAMARDEDSSSRRRAIPHLAEASDWKRVAESAAPFVRNRASTSSEVDVELGRLLGTSASNSSVARVRDQLPWRVRQPKLLRRLVWVAAILIGTAFVYLAIGRVRAASGKEPELIVISPTRVHPHRETWPANLQPPCFFQRSHRIRGMRVAIVGGPGVGKSTLVRQLGDLYHHGSYGEGEKGVWEPRVLADIEAGLNPVGVTAYFGELYAANYRDALDHDRPDRVIFIEGALITLEAHIAEYPAEYHTALREVLTMGEQWNPDRTIVLTSGSDTIEKHIRQRRRAHEQVENTVRRFRLIDSEFRRLAAGDPNAIILDRDGVEFHERSGLEWVIREVGLPPFEEIPYEQMNRYPVAGSQSR